MVRRPPTASAAMRRRRVAATAGRAVRDRSDGSGPARRAPMLRGARRAALADAVQPARPLPGLRAVLWRVRTAVRRVRALALRRGVRAFPSGVPRAGIWPRRPGRAVLGQVRPLRPARPVLAEVRAPIRSRPLAAGTGTDPAAMLGLLHPAAELVARLGATGPGAASAADGQVAAAVAVAHLRVAVGHAVPVADIVLPAIAVTWLRLTLMLLARFTSMSTEPRPHPGEAQPQSEFHHRRRHRRRPCRVTRALPTFQAGGGGS